MSTFRSQISPTVIAVALAVAGCGSGAAGALGSPCASDGDCDGRTQCLAGVCAGLCTADSDCGGGYTCADDGRCEVVGATAGAACQRERDCGPGLSCQLDPGSGDTGEPGDSDGGDSDPGDGDSDGNGTPRAGTTDRLPARCRPELPGRRLGAACTDDLECRSGLCGLGRCTALCATDGDCSTDQACVDTPSTVTAGALYASCAPAEGTATVERALAGPSGVVEVPVPSHAVSFAVTASVSDPGQVVGATRVVDPTGRVLYDRRRDRGDNALRFAASLGASTVLVPNSPTLELLAGVYRVEVGAWLGEGAPGTLAPAVTIEYRLGRPGTRLDLALHIANLDRHPCLDELGFTDAAEAAAARGLREEFLPELRRIFASAGIDLGQVRLLDLPAQPEFAVVDADDLDPLMAQGQAGGAVDLFLVRGLRPAGLQAVGGGARAAPRLANAPASGVALSAETLCYRSWRDTARVAAHAVARQLGLFRSVEPDGTTDPIPDSGTDSANLLYFGEYGGTDLSDGQADVLRANPVVK